MDILNVDPTVTAPDIDAQNAVIVWLQALINHGPYATLDEAKAAITASDWLASIQASLTTAKAAIPLPTPPILTAPQVEMIPPQDPGV